MVDRNRGDAGYLLHLPINIQLPSLGDSFLERSVALILSLAICHLLSAANTLATQPDEDARRQSGSVSDIVDLISTPRRESASKNQIRIRGAISVVAGMLGTEVTNPNSKSFCLEDASAGIWVRVEQAVDEGLLEDPTVLDELHTGIVVEIEGSLHPGGFAPVVLPRRIKVLDEGKLSSAISPDLKDFFRGAYIMRRVTIGGVVQNVTDDSQSTLR